MTGPAAPRRRIHPAAWATLGAVVALLVAGGAYLALRPAAAAQSGNSDRATAIHLCEDSILRQVLAPTHATFSDESYTAGDPTSYVSGAVSEFGGTPDTWDCTLVKSGGSLSVATATLHDGS